MRRVRSTEDPVDRSEMREDDGLLALAREATGLPTSTSGPAFASVDTAVLSTLATLDGPAGTVKPAKREIEVRAGHFAWMAGEVGLGKRRTCLLGRRQAPPSSFESSNSSPPEQHPQIL